MPLSREMVLRVVLTVGPSVDGLARPFFVFSYQSIELIVAFQTLKDIVLIGLRGENVRPFNW